MDIKDFYILFEEMAVAQEVNNERIEILLGNDIFAGIDEDETRSKRVRKIDSNERIYTLYPKYMPKIEENFPSNEKKFINHVMNYRNKNIEILSSIYPTKYPIFGPDDKGIIFTTTGIDPYEMQKDIKAVKLPDNVKDKANFKAEFVVLLMLFQYYLKRKDSTKYKIISRYFAYSMYWSIYKRSFNYNPKPQVMHYTIDTSDNKFILKKLDSIDSLLVYCVNSAIRNNLELLEDPFDYSYSYIIDGIKGAIGGKIKTIADKYYKNDKEKLAIFESEDNINLEVRSRTMDVESLANKYTTLFFSSDIRKDILKLAISKGGEASMSELTATVRTLIDNQRVEEVNRFFQCLFFSYLSEPEADNDLQDRKKFIFVSDKIYKRGHTSDKNDIELKKLLAKWLTEGSSTFVNTRREPTRKTYQKALYLYFIFFVALSR